MVQTEGSIRERHRAEVAQSFTSLICYDRFDQLKGRIEKVEKDVKKIIEDLVQRDAPADEQMIEKLRLISKDTIDSIKVV